MQLTVDNMFHAFHKPLCFQIFTNSLHLCPQLGADWKVPQIIPQKRVQQRTVEQVAAWWKEI